MSMHRRGRNICELRMKSNVKKTAIPAIVIIIIIIIIIKSRQPRKKRFSVVTYEGWLIKDTAQLRGSNF